MVANPPSFFKLAFFLLFFLFLHTMMKICTSASLLYTTLMTYFSLFKIMMMCFTVKMEQFLVVSLQFKLSFLLSIMMHFKLKKIGSAIHNKTAHPPPRKLYTDIFNIQTYRYTGVYRHVRTRVRRCKIVVFSTFYHLFRDDRTSCLFHVDIYCFG